VVVSPNGPVSISARGDVTPPRAEQRDRAQTGDPTKDEGANQDHQHKRRDRRHGRAGGVGPVTGTGNVVLVSPEGPVTITGGVVTTGQNGDVTPPPTPPRREQTSRTHGRAHRGAPEAERRAYQTERDAARVRKPQAPGVVNVTGNHRITITGVNGLIDIGRDEDETT
jgi:hypothetical protein